MSVDHRLDSTSRSNCGKFGSRKREEAPRAVLRGASFAPLSVVFQKTVEKNPESDLALAAFILIFFLYAFGTLWREVSRREEAENEAKTRIDSDEDRRNR